MGARPRDWEERLDGDVGMWESASMRAEKVMKKRIAQASWRVVPGGIREDDAGERRELNAELRRGLPAIDDAALLEQQP